MARLSRQQDEAKRHPGLWPWGPRCQAPLSWREAGTQQPRSADFSLLTLDFPFQLQISWGHLDLPDVVGCDWFSNSVALCWPRPNRRGLQLDGQVSSPPQRTSPCLLEVRQLLLGGGGLLAKSCQSLFRPHGLQAARLLCPWHFPGKNTGVGCYFLLQGIFPVQGSNLCLLHWQVDSLPLSHQGSLTVYDLLQMIDFILYIHHYLL